MYRGCLLYKTDDILRSRANSVPLELQEKRLQYKTGDVLRSRANSVPLELQEGVSFPTALAIYCVTRANSVP